MDQKIKELLSRLSFFAEDGMADKPIVEIAKQADALLMEAARKPNTQHPVAQITGGKTYMSVELLENCPADLPNGAQLYLSPPVPRDVLMAFGEAIQKDCLAQLVKAVSTEHAQLLVEGVDIASIADRYASKVHPDVELVSYAPDMETCTLRIGDEQYLFDRHATKPEPVNQQLLAALNNAADALERAEFFEQAAATRAAIAAEAAQPVGQDGYAQGVEAVAKMLEKKADDFASENGYDDMGSLSFCGNRNGELMRDYHSGLLELAEEVRAMKTDCQQPASAQPVAVPAEMTPAMMRAVQLRSELGAYSAANFSGAYDLFAEFWRVALEEAKKGGAA